MMEIAERLKAAIADRYLIERELGQGGMATVYLAHDVKHDRKVALKVLRPELAAVIGGERFLHEIKVTANLQHSHILPLYDSGTAEGFLYYVMPYVEGETLRTKLAKEKQLGVDEAVALARAVAGALDHAHRRGVIHRDIKPENILLRDGDPLIADFGIALALSHAGGNRLTETGLSIGTPHYMSPEQAMGDRELDPRSDVYSLGAVLYEMLTGDPPYTGSTAQAIVAKVITEKAPLVTTIRDTVPPHVAGAIQKALNKLPADRFHSAAEFAAALASQGLVPLPEARIAAAAHAAPSARRPVAAGLAVVGVMAALALVATFLGWLPPRGQDPRPVLRFPMDLPASERLGAERGVRLVLSPDGSRFAYLSAGPAGAQILIRRRDQLTATPLTGTGGASHLFYAPDGSRVGYLAAEPATTIRVAALGGGPPLVVTDSAVGLDGATWSADGFIYFDGLTAGGTTGLVRVRPGGGPREAVTTVDIGAGESDHIWPEALPDGKGILFTIARGQDLADADIGVLPPEGGPHRVLVRGIGARYAGSGHLVYVTAGGVLMAVRFDLDRLEVRGEAVAIAEGLAVRPFGAVDITVSPTGTLMYVTGSQVTEPGEIVRVTRDGQAEPVDPGWVGDFRTLAVSPDGRQLALSIVQGPEQQVWVKQLPRGPLSKLTFDGTTAYRPAWTPDGQSVGYISNNRDGLLSLYVRRADGSAMARWLGVDSVRAVGEVSWSRDGRWMVYQVAGTGFWARRTSGDTTPIALTTSAQGVGFGAALSPDGRWLAYGSAESGRFEVYVRPFPDTQAAKWQVSNRGGSMPRWSPDGRELYYHAVRDSLVAVRILPGTGFVMGDQRALFPNVGFRRTLGAYDVLPDGSFIMVRQNLGTETGQQLIVVENVFSVLREQVTDN